MDEELSVRGLAMRLLAWATAALLVAGVSVAGARASGSADREGRTVAAAGEGADPVGGSLPATAPSTVAALTTTAPTTVPSTVAVSPTAPPTTRATTTTSPARPTTTTSVAAKPVAPATTTTAASSAGKVTVTVANDYTYAVVVTLNGRSFQLAPGQQVGPVDLALAPNGNDVVEVRLVAEPTCGLGDAGGVFAGPGRYRFAVVNGPSTCLADPAHPIPGPSYAVTPA